MSLELLLLRNKRVAFNCVAATIILVMVTSNMMNNSYTRSLRNQFYQSTSVIMQTSIQQHQEEENPNWNTAIPLPQLVNAHRSNHNNNNTECPDGFVYIPDTILDSSEAYQRTIPKIVHVTSKSRCMLPVFAKTIDKWRFPHHSLFFHDDDAVDRLMNKYFPEFPSLQVVAHCLLPGACKADLWRALVLYEYGGIYTDVDNEPAAFNGTFEEQDEAYFVVEQLGVPSQYFFASAPRHPLMYDLVQITINRILTMNDVKHYDVATYTGPGALKTAFIYFMNDQGPNNPRGRINHTPQYDRVVAGVYTGFNNRTVTIVGTKEDSNYYVIRGGRGMWNKAELYKQMNMTHFLQQPREDGELESCMHRIHNRLTTNNISLPFTTNKPGILW